MTKEEEQQRFLELSALFNKNNAIKHIILLEQKIADYESSRVELPVKPEIAVIESAKIAISKAHTLALKFAVLRGNRIYDDEVYAEWQKAHIEFQEALKQFSV